MEINFCSQRRKVKVANLRFFLLRKECGWNVENKKEINKTRSNNGVWHARVLLLAFRNTARLPITNESGPTDTLIWAHRILALRVAMTIIHRTASTLILIYCKKYKNTCVETQIQPNVLCIRSYRFIQQKIKNALFNSTLPRHCVSSVSARWSQLHTCHI